MNYVSEEATPVCLRAVEKPLRELATWLVRQQTGVASSEQVVHSQALTVEGLFYRLLLAETTGLRERAAERRQRPGAGESR